MMRLLFTLVIFTTMSCSNSINMVEKDLRSNVVGEWIMKSKFLGDAIDTPCGYAAKLNRDITLNISKSGDQYNFNGQSAVNLYNGSFTIESVDSSLKIGYIKVSQIGSSKMAGPPELMECETYLYNFLNEAAEIRVDESGTLNVGRFKKDSVPSRDGGTYFIYERKKL